MESRRGDVTLTELRFRSARSAAPTAHRPLAGRRAAVVMARGSGVSSQLWRRMCMGVATPHATNSGEAMPVVSPDSSAPGTPTTALFVWESLEQSGDHALCTDQQHPDFQNPHWRFRGELRDGP